VVLCRVNSRNGHYLRGIHQRIFLVCRYVCVCVCARTHIHKYTYATTAHILIFCESLQQLCGGFPDTMARCAELISTHTSVDFVDINVGCPIDVIFKMVGAVSLCHASQSLLIILGCWQCANEQTYKI